MVTAGLALLGLAVLLGRRDPARFFHAYLAAWLFGISLGVGALLFVLIQFAARAGWSVAIRRLAEHVMTTVPVFAVAALPLAFGLSFLYPSVEPAGAASRHAFSPRGIWLDPAFLLSRSLVYLAGWSAVAVWFRRRSLMQDRTRDPRETARLRVAS
ncbi:MAG: hypothetical protein ACE5HU_10025, partial [Acidobacteriota bacterium]